MRQQACEVTQLLQTINRMARTLDAHLLCEEKQCLGMKEWLEYWDTMWDNCHRDTIQWATGIMDMTMKVLVKSRFGEAILTQEVGN